jgi:hypothetical protein
LPCHLNHLYFWIQKGWRKEGTISSNTRVNSRVGREVASPARIKARIDFFIQIKRLEREDTIVPKTKRLSFKARGGILSLGLVFLDLVRLEMKGELVNEAIHMFFADC